MYMSCNTAVNLLIFSDTEASHPRKGSLVWGIRFVNLNRVHLYVTKTQAYFWL